VSDGPDDPGRVQRPGWIDRVQHMRFVELFEKYRRRMVHRETGLPFEPTRELEPLTIERLAFETGAALRLLLKLFFPFCATLFAISFVWDLESRLLRACSVAGMIGFGTNWVAIKMLFWPRESRPVFGHGLIPSQRDQLIEKVADEVLEKLINEDLILQKIEEIQVVQRFSNSLIEKLREVVREDEFKADVKRVVLTYAGELAANPEFRARVGRKAERSMEEFAGASFKGWVVKRLKEVWRRPLTDVINRELDNLDETLDHALGEVDGVLDHLPTTLEKRQEAIDKVLTSMLLGIVREVDLREIILEQLSTVTSEDLETGFREFSDDKLSFITLLGGLFGLIGGPVIIWPLPSLVVLLSLATVATILDIAIHPFMKTRYWPTRAERHPHHGPRPSGSGAHASVDAPGEEETAAPASPVEPAPAAGIAPAEPPSRPEA